LTSKRRCFYQYDVIKDDKAKKGNIIEESNTESEEVAAIE